jgi:hypothetical protein
MLVALDPWFTAGILHVPVNHKLQAIGKLDYANVGYPLEIGKGGIMLIVD